MAHSGIALLGIAVVVVPLLLFVGVFATEATVEESQRVITIDNESFQPAGGNVSVLDKSNLSFADYNGTVTVRNASTGSVFPEAGNYTWTEGNGTITPDVNSDLANASTAEITYGYRGLSQEQTAVASVVVQLQGIAGELALLFGAVLTLGGLTLMGARA